MSKKRGNRAFLSFTEYKILNSLIKKDNQICKEISEDIKISQTKVCKRLLHLEKLGLIKQEPAKNSNGKNTHGKINSINNNKNKIKNFLDLINGNSL